MALSDVQARRRVAAVEAFLARLEALPEESRAVALDAVRGLVDLYGEAFERLLAGAPDLLEVAVGDELVSHLLVLHGLHPAGLEARVEAALDEVRPYLASHGGGVELVAIEGARVRLALSGRCDGCPSSAATLRLAVEEAIRNRAPEVEAVEAAIASPAGPAPGPCLGPAAEGA